MTYEVLSRPERLARRSAAAGRKVHGRIIVGSPNDPLERHADRVATRVISGMDSTPSQVERGGLVPRPGVRRTSSALSSFTPLIRKLLTTVTQGPAEPAPSRGRFLEGSP